MKLSMIICVIFLVPVILGSRATETNPEPPPTTTVTPVTTTTASPTTKSTPTTHSTPSSSTSTTSKTTSTSPMTTTSTVAPPTPAPITPPTTPPTTHTPSTITPPSPTPSPKHDRSFDVTSFIGGFILSLALVAIGFVSFKFYKNRAQGSNYHTL